MNQEAELGECPECGGVTEPQRRTIDERWGEELFIFEDVPVKACRNCGEVYITAFVAKRLEGEMLSKNHCCRRVAVPVVAYEEVAA